MCNYGKTKDEANFYLIASSFKILLEVLLIPFIHIYIIKREIPCTALKTFPVKTPCVKCSSHCYGSEKHASLTILSLIIFTLKFRVLSVKTESTFWAVSVLSETAVSSSPSCIIKPTSLFVFVSTGSTSARLDQSASRGHCCDHPTAHRKAEKLPFPGLKGHTGGMVLCSGLVIVLIVC